VSERESRGEAMKNKESERERETERERERERKWLLRWMREEEEEASMDVSNGSGKPHQPKIFFFVG
jgi:hypothetical protein